MTVFFSEKNGVYLQRRETFHTCIQRLCWYLFFFGFDLNLSKQGRKKSTKQVALDDWLRDQSAPNYIFDLFYFRACESEFLFLFSNHQRKKRLEIMARLDISLFGSVSTCSFYWDCLYHIFHVNFVSP